MRRFLIMLTALFAVMPVFAQWEDDFNGPGPKEKSNAFFIGPKVGLTMSSMSQPNEGKLADGSGLGFAGGVAMAARFGKASESSPAGTGYFGARLELNYMQNAIKTLGTDEGGATNANLSLSYFNVPVAVQFFPLPKNAATNTFYIEAGCSFGCLLSAKPETLTVLNPSDDFSKVVYNINANGSKLKGGAVSPLVGIGYTIPNIGVGINARYYLGMSELAGNFPCKVSTFEVSASWLFSIEF